MNWNSKKAQVEAILDTVPTTKAARKTILAFERRVNTLRNRLDTGATWEAVAASPAALQAHELLNSLNAEGFYEVEKAEHYTSWAAYADAHDYNLYICLADAIC